MLNSVLQVSGLGFTCDGARDSFVYQEAWQKKTTETRNILRHFEIDRGTQREYSSKPLKHSIVKSILVFKR